MTCHPADHLTAEAVRWEGQGETAPAGPLFQP
jgi:hypothetical protein